METTNSRREDDLNDIERRLAGWQPAGGSLNADAMLFAAGIAAGRRGWGRVVGPALCAFLTAGLCVWGLSERGERISLARRLSELAPIANASPETAVAIVPNSMYEPRPGDYWSTRRQMEQDPNRWLASIQSGEPRAFGPLPPQAAILTARQRAGLIEQ